MRATLERRLRTLRSRQLVRAWEYRQRHLGRGVWFRLRRLLADASAAWSIPVAEARRLVAGGHPSEPVGTELEPPRVILFLPLGQASAIPGARRLEVRLDAALLHAEALALVRFEAEADADPTQAAAAGVDVAVQPEDAG